MSRVSAIRTELLDGHRGLYLYWDDPLYIKAERRGRSGVLCISHLEVDESARGEEWASDALTALEQVAVTEGYDVLEANIGATDPPEDGSDPGMDDPSARCLQQNGFQDITSRQSHRGETKWGYTATKPVSRT